MNRMIERLIPLLLLAGAPVCGADPHMTPEERTKLLKWLEESRQEFLGATDGVSEQQWKWKPAPERWSVGETAEHIVVSEAALFGYVQKALSLPANSAWETETKGKTERLEAVLAPRLGKAQAPEPLVPKGNMTLREVRQRFETQRTEIVKFAQETDSPLKEHIVNNPFFGPLNGYQWLIYGPLHTMRHDKQIAEVKGTSGYPK
ncbi:MAG TPA: DinB family protein [Bryobacteraceae bacterium]|nr:DinB family protein [Bryobacteraceae bacterium]